MKKDENMETAQANIELNEKMNEDNNIIHRKKVNSTEEANIAIQEEFYSDKKHEDVLPTYINNETPAIKITGKD